MSQTLEFFDFWMAPVILSSQCEVYDLQSKRYETVTLSNTTEHGLLTSSLAVEQIPLA